MPHNLQRLDEGWPEPNAQNVEKFNCLTAEPGESESPGFSVVSRNAVPVAQLHGRILPTLKETLTIEGGLHESDKVGSTGRGLCNDHGRHVHLGSRCRRTK